jgi:FixJ family two-component response regulator
MAGTTIRVAVVDDDASIRRALKRFLGAFSFSVETYDSGRNFLESLGGFSPDCVVLDLHMEGMNGLDVQRHLRRIGKQPPVIMITGHDNPAARTESLTLGAGAFLTKPVDGPLLISTIERLTGEIQPA